jgi:hypothetical protein
MRGVRISVNEAHGHGFETLGGNAGGCPFD